LICSPRLETSWDEEEFMAGVGNANERRLTRAEIASLGGKAAHAGGCKSDGTPRKKAHQWTPAEAREAGRKGGSASHRKPVKSDLPVPAELSGMSPDERAQRDMEG
jgi:general stress protein YciG